MKRAKEMEKYKFSVVDVEKDTPYTNEAMEKIIYLVSYVIDCACT